MRFFIPSVTPFILSLSVCFSLAHPFQASVPSQAQSNLSTATSRALVGSPEIGDHPDWQYQNAKKWYLIDPTLQDHHRLHSYLSMSIYGPFNQTCPLTFTQGFTVVHSIPNIYYAAIVPEMRKVVLVFAGVGDYRTISWNPVTMEDIVPDCPGCLVAQGVKELYLRVRSLTNDFAVARKAVASTGLLFSSTGLGVGGAISALASMDLAVRSSLRYSHNSGMPRAFNYQAAVRYDNLFQFLAGQSGVARDDYMVHVIPRGVYYHLGQKLHLTGEKTQWLTTCFGNNENSTCLGAGTSRSDHTYYFTPIGQCGNKDKGF